jgi:hypothetical protein
LYQQLRERNLCMHRDYQNVGVNGGASDNMRPPNGIIVSMKARNGNLPYHESVHSLPIPRANIYSVCFSLDQLLITQPW